MCLNGISWMDESEHNLIRTAHSSLRAFLCADALPFVEFSHEQLRQFVELLNEDVQRNPRIPAFGFQVVHATSCYLLTFLSALATHQLQAKAAVQRRHGEESTECELVGNLFRSAFDENLGYRFCYKLRNFAVHCGLDFLSLRITRGRTESNQLTVPDPTVTVVASREYLLAFPTAWGAQVRNEIASMAEEIAVVPLAEDALMATRRVSQESRLLLHPDIHDQLEVMRKTALKFTNIDGTPALVGIEGLVGSTRAGYNDIPMICLDFSMILAVEEVLKGRRAQSFDKMFSVG